MTTSYLPSKAAVLLLADLATELNSGDLSLALPVARSIILNEELPDDTPDGLRAIVSSLEQDSSVKHPLFACHLSESLLADRDRKSYSAYYTPDSYSKPLIAELLNRSPCKSNQPLSIFDPACGAGNLLVTTFMMLAERESEPIPLSCFYGIELNNAIRITAKDTLAIAYQFRYGVKAEGNPTLHLGVSALVVRWESIVPAGALIISNPPFKGVRVQSEEHYNNVVSVVSRLGYGDNHGNFDLANAFVALAMRLVNKHGCVAGFITPVSATGGEQLTLLNRMLSCERVATRTISPPFIWTGLGLKCTSFVIYSDKGRDSTTKPELVITKKSSPCFAYTATIHSQSTYCGGNLIVSRADYLRIIQEYGKEVAAYFVKYASAQEILSGTDKYVLSVATADALWERNPRIKQMVDNCRNYRETATDSKVRRLQHTPHLLNPACLIPGAGYIAIPKYFSANSYRLPLALSVGNTAYSVLALVAYSPQTYAVLSSSMYLAWCKHVCATTRPTSISHTVSLGYNNFPFPDKAKLTNENLTRLVNNLLTLRGSYKDELTLRQFYATRTIPQEVKTILDLIDEQVDDAYGFRTGERLAFLTDLYTERLGGSLPKSLFDI